MRELLEEGVLTQEQYDTIIDSANEILCLACAGSGKSRTLSFRIARLIKEGANPESIIAFTFTEKAAESLKRNVASALEKCSLPVAMVGAMYIGTIHSYCQNLLGLMNASYRQYEVLDENRLKLFLLSRYYELELQQVQVAKNSRMFQTISEVSNAWKMANDEMLNLDEIEDEDEELGRCLKNIRTRLHDDQYIDFSLMIRLVVDALEENNTEINNALENINHLMVDEYQDVNVSQERLIRGLYERIQTLFVVGDDDQSIYGWRGADVRNIIEFEQRYPHCSPHTLSTNFRSTETIVNASNQFIQNELSTARIDKNPVSHSNGNIRHFGNLWFETREEEAQWVARRINELLGTKYIEVNGTERGLTKSDIAILMRSVQGGTRNGGAPYHRAYTNALQDAEIDYLIEAEGSIFERLHARILRETMGLLRNPGISRRESLNYFNSNILPVFPNARLNDFLDLLSEWNNQIHRPLGGARRKVYPQKLVHELLEVFNISTTEFVNHEQVMRDLGVFSGIILDIEKVFVSIDTSQRYQTVLNFLSNVAESGYDTTQVELMSRPDAVTISTVHKMKGLEFPIVFVVDILQQRFPGRRSNYNGWLPTTLIQDTLARGMYQNNNAGEARLFYTAMTRAERFLYLTGSSIQPGLMNPKRPSPFKLRIANLNFESIITDSGLLPEGLETAEQRMRIDEESMPTSFTEIKDYLECPMKYKFRKIYGYSPAVPELFGYGLTTHTAINRLHQLYPDSSPNRTQAEEVAGNVFHVKHVFPSNNPDREGPYERARNASQNLVGNYAHDYPSDFSQSRSLEQRFEIQAGKALITGSIDLLLREDEQGNILDAKVIDFKSIDYPEGEVTPFFWINLSLQVQLYSHAADVVLGENAKTGAVHLLKAANVEETPNRVDVPITDDAINSAVKNVEWAVNRILEGEFPMRPSESKCNECDFNKICSKRRQEFNATETPEAIHIPETDGINDINVRCFSDLD
ncbi:ATP-dependent DNA helicase [uncultured Draconibacterium sp.]|uniref:ATP-dependent DNA helicase n=1 Tax=uncultured Draconibacterium sp. TaxID=1573823 RepID=UPI00321670FE